MNWFWGSKFIGWVESNLVCLTNYIWKKRREQEKKVISKIKEDQKKTVAANTATKTTRRKTTRKKPATKKTTTRKKSTKQA